MAKVGSGIEAALAFKGPAGDCQVEITGSPVLDVIEAIAQHAAQATPIKEAPAPTPAGQ